jgi:uncharacterized protein involved in outer membrane biogenesis
MRVGKILAILGGVAVLLVGGVIVFIKSIDVEKYKPMIAEKAKEATGRDLILAGKIDLKISLSPALVIENVSFANAPWGSRPEMVKLKRFEAEVGLMPLLSGNVQVKRLILIEPDILIETDAKGKGNWEMQPAAGKPKDAPKPEEKKAADAKGAGGLPPIEIDEVRIEKASFVYKDGKAAKTTKLLLDHLSVKGKSLSSPLGIDLAGAFDAKSFAVTGQLGAPSDLLAGEKPWPLKIEAKAGGAVVGVDGTIAKAMEGKGLALKLSVNLPDAQAFGTFIGAELPKLPAIMLTGQLSDPQGGYAISDLKLSAGKSQVAGKVQVAMGGPRPKANVQLASPLVDLSELLPQAESKPSDAKQADAKQAGAGAGAKKDRLFSDDPLPLDGLKAADTDLDLKLDKLILPNKIALDGVAVKLMLANGRLEISPASLKIGGGDLASRVMLDGSSGKSALLNVKLDGKGVVIGQLLKEMGQKEAFSGGKTEIVVNLAGQGGSVRALMAGLNGDATIQTYDGKINNTLINWGGGDLLTQLLGSLNPMAKKEDSTPVSCGVLRAVIKDGMTTIDKGLAVETQKLNVVGSGTINLKTEELDMGVKPTVKEGLGVGVGNLASLVRIKGTLANPATGIDEMEAAKKALSVGTAIATGGVSLLTGALVDKATADSAPCQTALGKAPAKQAGAQPQQQQQQAKPDITKDPAGAVGGAIRGLFGR